MRFAAFYPVLMAISVLVGCAGTPAQDDAGVSASSGMALTPDGYPNINIVPEGETAQFTPQEKQELAAQLRSALARQRAGDTSRATAAEIAQLRALARRHAADVLREIEAS